MWTFIFTANLGHFSTEGGIAPLTHLLTFEEHKDILMSLHDSKRVITDTTNEKKVTRSKKER